MTPWEDLERELKLALHPTFADRLLDNLLESDNMLGAYGHVADLVAGLRHPAAAAELRREDETVLAMVRELRAAAPSTVRTRSYGRRSLALVAVMAMMSTSAAWAAGVPAAIQQAAVVALDDVGEAIARARGATSETRAAAPREVFVEQGPASGPLGADRPSRRAPVVIEDIVIREYEETDFAPETVEPAADVAPTTAEAVAAPVASSAPGPAEPTRPEPAPEQRPAAAKPAPVADESESSDAIPTDVVPDPASVGDEQPTDVVPVEVVEDDRGHGRPDDPGKSGDSAKDDKSKDEKPKDDASKDDKPKDEKSSDDKSNDDKAHDDKSKDEKPKDSEQPGSGQPADPPKHEDKDKGGNGQGAAPVEPQPPAQPPVELPVVTPPPSQSNGDDEKNKEKKDKKGE